MSGFRVSLSQLAKLWVMVLASVGLAFSQTLPTAKTIAAEMGVGWNLGNTMEAIGGPTAWGNDIPSQALIDSIKAAGFKTIRIPAAWDGYADPTTHVISAAWMQQVKQVVDMCIKDSLFVVLNIHWDGGWLENQVDSIALHPERKALIAAKQGAYWRQIATTFRNYDRHMLFASANEPGVSDAAAMATLNSFHQIFIDTVRATGGNNASRTLILQGPSTSAEKSSTLWTTLPSDKIADRIMAEVHYYPYQFTLMEQDADWGKVFYYWGKPYHSLTDPTRNPTWGEESYTDSVNNLMKTQFVDKNIPVLIGEVGAIKRLSLTGEPLERHILSRRYFYQYVVSSCKARGLIPVVWDAGGKGNGTMSVFDRKTGGTYDLGLLNAIRFGIGLPKLAGDTSAVQMGTGNSAMKVLCVPKDSGFAQVSLGVLKPDFSAYDSILVKAFVNGTTNYDSAGVSKNGIVSLSLVTMSKNWTWKESSFGTLAMNSWKTYAFPITTDTTVKGAMTPADPKKVDFFAIQAYTKGFKGTLYVDHILFKTKAGVSDTLYPFDLTVPEAGGGNVVSVKLIPIDNVASDQEWKTLDSKGNPTLHSPLTRKWLRSEVSKGMLKANYFAAKSGWAQATLLNLQGKVIGTYAFQAQVGWNHFEIPVGLNPLSFLEIRQDEQRFTQKVAH